MIVDPRRSAGITAVGWDRPMPIQEISGRDWKLSAEWRAWWHAGGSTTVLVLPAGWRFGPGVSSTPGLWRALANPMHMIQSSCVHDWLYSSQGGARQLDVDGETRSAGVSGITRAFADALAFAIALEHGASYWSALRAWLACRMFGARAWNE